MKPWAYETTLEASSAWRMASTKAAFSSAFTVSGLTPLPSFVAASSRCDLSAERQRAKTASPMRVTGMPCSSASMPVHLPVPFWPAVSRIFSTSGVPSASLNLRISAVISIKYESSSVLFHSVNAALISSQLMPSRPCIRWYASQQSCMSPYSMPLCTIFT